jgi:hypothetical protein
MTIGHRPINSLASYSALVSVETVARSKFVCLFVENSSHDKQQVFLGKELTDFFFS